MDFKNPFNTINTTKIQSNNKATHNQAFIYNYMWYTKLCIFYK